MTEITIENYVGFALGTEPGDYVEPFERLCPHAEVNNFRLLYGALGLASEIGELLEWRAKGAGNKYEELAELGDMLWYTSIIVDAYGFDMRREWFDDSDITSEFMGRNGGLRAQVVPFHEILDNLSFSISSICDYAKQSIMHGKDIDR